MDDQEDIRQILRDIRDTQREHLAEYRKAAAHALQLQQQAVTRQDQIGNISRRLALLGGVLIAILMTLLVYLLVRWSRQLFGF